MVCTVIGITLLIAFLLLAVMYVVYRMVFFVPDMMKSDPKQLPRGRQYEQRRKEMLEMIDEVLSIPYEDVWVTSQDGLKLHGRYYHVLDGAPLEILFHGYQSVALRDFCGGLKLALTQGHNVLLIDQRAHGESEGKYLTFGVKERQDCLCWVEYAIDRFGEDVRILLMGISMGAATVLMATELPMPKQVIGVIADSGYTSPKEIIRKVLNDRHYPVGISYFAIALSARIFGRFSLEVSAEDAMRSCTLPILLIHGEADHFVPCEMSRKNFAACASEKYLLTVPDAGHGIAYLVDEKAYVSAVNEFWNRIGI